MADDEEAAPKEKEKKRDDEDDAEICKEAIARYNKWQERERENIAAAYEDKRFRIGEQWDKKALEARKDRPCLTINRIPQFIRQVTGDMRQMKPSIKTVPVDSRGDKDTAETLAGMIRYIENRSDASGIYIGGAESQVDCGIGHWAVTKEYADGTTFNQELRIVAIDDQVAVACDPDAKLIMKEDAKWWIIPVDMSRESFEENYPDASVEDFDDVKQTAGTEGWFDKDFVRVAVYWVKKPIKRVLALMPDGSIADLTDEEESERLQIGKTAKKVETRDSFKVCRYLITACHVLEEVDWPGMNIPVVPVLGEEIKIGKRIVRHGLTRFARDPQRMVNYYSSAEAEVVALQPKSPFIGTEKNFQKNQEMWATANTEAHSALIYTPDPANGNAAPQRVQPAVGSTGISEGLDRAVNDMKAVIGIYDPGLGNKSNETSGKAIIARQREGDTGTYIYIDNWTRSIRRTGAILIDLIPHVYDTERMIRVMGEDGKVDLKWINKPTGEQVIDEKTGKPGAVKVENDVTIGAYDVVLDTGPSYTTKRAEARDSMTSFIQSAPETAPAIMDLVAKAQDWPMADEVAKRLEAIAPPPVQKLIAKQKKEQGEEEQPDPPSQGEQMQQQAAMLDLQNKQLANQKIQAEINNINAEAQAKAQPHQADPVAMMKVQREQQSMALDARRAKFEFATAMAKATSDEKIAAVQLETALVDLAIKKQGIMINTAGAVQDMQRNQQGMQQDAERHAQTLTQGAEKHGAAMTQGAENMNG